MHNCWLPGTGGAVPPLALVTTFFTIAPLLSTLCNFSHVQLLSQVDGTGGAVPALALVTTFLTMPALTLVTTFPTIAPGPVYVDKVLRNS